MPHTNDFSGVYQISTLSIDDVSGLNSRLVPEPVPKTLYYKLKTSDGQYFFDVLNYQVTPHTSEFNGILVTPLTDNSWNPISNTTIVFFEHRVPTPNTSEWIDNPMIEKFIIKDNDTDMVSALSVYQDSGSGAETTITEAKYTIESATGKYKGQTTATIFFDNDGTNFGNGQLFARRIELE